MKELRHEGPRVVEHTPALDRPGAPSDEFAVDAVAVSDVSAYLGQMPASRHNSRTRWLVINGVRFLAIAGALLGVALIAKAHTTAPKVLGAALVLAALYFMATVTGALARRWRSPVP